MKKTKYYVESKPERAERIAKKKQPPKLKFPITPLFVKTDIFTVKQFLLRFEAWMKHNNSASLFLGWSNGMWAVISEAYIRHLSDNGCIYKTSTGQFLIKYDTKEIPDFKHDF